MALFRCYAISGRSAGPLAGGLGPDKWCGTVKLVRGSEEELSRQWATATRRVRSSAGWCRHAAERQRAVMARGTQPSCHGTAICAPALPPAHDTPDTLNTAYMGGVTRAVRGAALSGRVRGTSAVGTPPADARLRIRQQPARRLANGGDQPALVSLRARAASHMPQWPGTRVSQERSNVVRAAWCTPHTSRVGSPRLLS